MSRDLSPSNWISSWQITITISLIFRNRKYTIQQYSFSRRLCGIFNVILQNSIMLRTRVELFRISHDHYSAESFLFWLNILYLNSYTTPNAAIRLLYADSWFHNSSSSGLITIYVQPNSANQLSMANNSNKLDSYYRPVVVVAAVLVVGRDTQLRLRFGAWLRRHGKKCWAC